jgi:hypothetical protein
MGQRSAKFARLNDLMACQFHISGGSILYVAAELFRDDVWRFMTQPNVPPPTASSTHIARLCTSKVPISFRADWERTNFDRSGRRLHLW